MDITAAVRLAAIGLRTDPRSILVPRTDNENESLSKWLLSVNRPIVSLYSLAKQYHSENEFDYETDYFQRAEALLQEYVSLVPDTSPYLLFIANLCMDDAEDPVEVVDVLNDYYSSFEVAKSRLSTESVRKVVRETMKVYEEAHLQNADYYDNNIRQVLEDTESILPLVNEKVTVLKKRVEVKVTYQGWELTRANLEAIIRSIHLGERLYYASLQVSTDKVIRQVRAGARMKSDLPFSSNQSELLMLVSVPSRSDQEVILDVRTSTLRTEDEAFIPLVLEAIPDLALTESSEVLTTASISYPIKNLVPRILYYLMRTRRPWTVLLGADDSQYARRGMRNLLIRTRRWPIRDTILDQEIIHTLHTSYGANVVVGGQLEEGLTLTLRDVDPSVIGRTIELLSRLLVDYGKQEKSILPILASRFPSLSEPIDVRGVSKAKQLALLYPDIFGKDYNSLCDRRPDLSEEGAEGAEEIQTANGPIYLRCPERHQFVVRDDGERIIPCCIPIAKRAVINTTTHMEKNAEGYLYGIASIFGKKEKEKKGVSGVVRVGEGKSLKTVLANGIGRLNTASYEVAPFLQCMPSHTDEQVVSYLSQADWDSDWVIDGVALNNKLNIFVLEIRENRLLFRVPHFKFAYYVPFCYDWPSLFVYRHEGGSPVYELVRTTDSKSYKFPTEVTQRAIDVFREQFRTEVLDRDGHYSSLQDAGPYRESSMKTVHVQIIDSYGKLRGHQEKSGLVKYYDHPSAPLVGPHARRVDETRSAKEYARVREKLAPESEEWKNLPIGEEMVGLPTAAYWKEGKTELAWRHDTVRLYSGLDRERSFILQLVNWLYSNSLHQGLDIADFVDMFTIDETVTYHFDTVPGELGEYDYLEAMNYLKATNMVQEVEDKLKLVFPSEAVLFGVIQMLTIAHSSYESPTIPSRLVNTDFNVLLRRAEGAKFHTQVYLHDEASFRKWRDSQHNNDPDVDLSDPRVKLYKSPFPMVSSTRTKEKDRWLVQNVSNGSYLRAIQCCLTWLKDEKNPGFFVEQSSLPMDEVLRSVLVYTWDETRRLIPNEEPNGKNISLLVYPGYKKEGQNAYKGHFAALLPIYPS